MNDLTTEQQAARDRVIAAVRAKAPDPRHMPEERLPDGVITYAYGNATHIRWDVSRYGVCLGHGVVER